MVKCFKLPHRGLRPPPFGDHVSLLPLSSVSPRSVAIHLCDDVWTLATTNLGRAYYVRTSRAFTDARTEVGVGVLIQQTLILFDHRSLDSTDPKRKSGPSPLRSLNIQSRI